MAYAEFPPRRSALWHQSAFSIFLPQSAVHDRSITRSRFAASVVSQPLKARPQTVGMQRKGIEIAGRMQISMQKESEMPDALQAENCLPYLSQSKSSNESSQYDDFSTLTLSPKYIFHCSNQSVKISCHARRALNVTMIWRARVASSNATQRAQSSSDSAFGCRALFRITASACVEHSMESFIYDKAHSVRLLNNINCSCRHVLFARLTPEATNSRRNKAAAAASVSSSHVMRRAETRERGRLRR